MRPDSMTEEKTMAEWMPSQVVGRAYLLPKGAVGEFTCLPRPFCSLALLLEGSVRVREADRTAFTVGPGEVLFIPQGARYASLWEGDPTRYLACHFETPLQMGPERHYPVQKVRPETDLQPSFARVVQAGERQDCGGMEAFYHLLGALLPAFAGEDAPKRDSRVCAAEEYLRAHMRENVRVETLAALCYVSQAHFYSLFRAQTGLSPIAYKNRLRLTEAAERLARTAKPVSAIAEELGFESETHFRRAFTAFAGCAPRTFRKQAAGHNGV